MPSRLIREGILSSERVDALTLAGEVFYRRLMSAVDDYGRFDGHAGLLRAKCYPLRLDDVKEDDIAAWLGECLDAGLIVLYTVADKIYLEMQDFKQQQRSKSKYPQSTDGEMLDSAASVVRHVLAKDNTSAARMPIKRLATVKQLLTSVHLDVVGDGDEVGNSTEPKGSAPLSDFSLSLNDNSEYRVPLAKVALWKTTYPAVEVEQELREMAAWSLANKPKRKTARGVEGFIVRWLGKAQDTPSRATGRRDAGDWTGSAT